MNLEYELLREFDRVGSQCDQASSMCSNVNVFDNTGVSEEQGSMKLRVTGGFGEAGLNVASAEVKSETLEVMKAALAQQNGVVPSPLPSPSFPPEEVMTTQPINWKLDKGIPQFLSKVYQIVDDPMTDHVVHWGFEGKSFVVQDAATFCNVILPKYYKHGNFSSFIRQLNTYGFRKTDCDKWEFAAHGFQRGKIHQLKYIKRRTRESKKVGARLGKHDDTFQKYLSGLSAQISTLSQQVEVSSSIISAFEKRVQDIELKYRHMARVLSKTIQNPGFIAELIKRKASMESKYGDDSETETPSDQNMAETHGTSKLSSDSNNLSSNCNPRAQSPNQTEMELSVYMPAPSIVESSRIPNEPRGSAVEMMIDDPLESLDNEMMNEMEPCEEMGSEKCKYYFHELASLIGVEESNGDWVAYAANQLKDKKP